MAIRFRNIFRGENGQYWTVHIHDTEHSGDYTEYESAPPGFTLQYAGGEDIYHPIIPSTCTVPMYIQDSTGDTFLSDLATSDEGRFRITIRKGNGDNTALYWVGIITLDNITIEDAPHPHVVELKAVDGLQLLSRIPYDFQTGPFDILNVMVYCLKQIGTDDLWVTDGVEQYAIRYLNDIAADESTYDDAFNDVRLKPALWDPVAQAYDYNLDCETVLTQCARMYNNRVYLSDGRFWIDPVSKWIAGYSSHAHQDVQWDLDQQGTGGLNRFTVLPVDLAANQLVRLAGWSSQFITPVREIQRPLNYGEGTIISNENVGGVLIYPIGASSGDTLASYTFSSDNDVPVNSTFNIRGQVQIDADYLNITSNRTGRLRFAITLQVGDYYCRRFLNPHGLEVITVAGDTFNNLPEEDEECFIWEDPTNKFWDQSSSSRIQYGSDVINYNLELPNYATGQDDQTTIALDITTPPMPAQTGGDIQITFQCVLYDGDGTDATTAKKNATAVDVVFALTAGEGYNGSSVIYKSEIDNGASEIRVEDPVLFGSQLVFTGESYFNPAELYNVNGPLPDWVSGLTTTAADLHTVCVVDQLRYFNKPRRIWSGTVHAQSATLEMFHQVYDYTWLKYFMPVSMTFHADTAMYDVELHEIGQEGAPTSSVVKPGPGKPIPVLQSVDAINKRFERGIRSNAGTISDVVIDVEAINRTTDSSGGLSSVQLKYLGDVKISGPTNGQVLEYNSTAQRWANVTPTGGTDNSLSEADQTLNAGVTRKIILDGSAANLTYFKIVDANDAAVFSITNYGTILNIVEYFGLIAYRSTSTVKGSFALYEAAANGTNFIQLVAPDSVTANRVFTLPGDYGSSGDVLQSNGAGVMSWGTLFSYITLQSSFYSSDGNFDYVPIGGTLAETTSNQYYNIWTAPAAGELVKATCICSTTGAGSTTISVRKYPIPQTLASDTQTIPSTAYTTATFTFTGATFSAGDRLQFGFDPTGTPGGVQITFLIKLNH